MTTLYSIYIRYSTQDMMSWKKIKDLDLAVAVYHVRNCAYIRGVEKFESDFDHMQYQHPQYQMSSKYPTFYLSHSLHGQTDGRTDREITKL